VSFLFSLDLLYALCFRKAKNARSKRVLEKREPQLNESVKWAIFLRSTTSSASNHSLLSDLYALKKPYAFFFHKKEANLLPFDNDASLCFYSKKTDAALVCFGYHTKKRPNSILFGRFFDHQMLDLVELHVENYVPISFFKV
jgi:ribosome production factor 2